MCFSLAKPFETLTVNPLSHFGCGIRKFGAEKRVAHDFLRPNVYKTREKTVSHGVHRGLTSFACYFVTSHSLSHTTVHAINTVKQAQLATRRTTGKRAMQNDKMLFCCFSLLFTWPPARTPWPRRPPRRPALPLSPWDRLPLMLLTAPRSTPSETNKIRPKLEAHTNNTKAEGEPVLRARGRGPQGGSLRQR